MKKVKQLYFLTLIIVVMLIMTLVKLHQKLPTYHIKNAICLNDITLLISVDDKKKKMITKRKVLIYKGEKISYEIVDISQDLLTLKIHENICKQKNIEIIFFDTKKKILSILLESWKKDEKNK